MSRIALGASLVGLIASAIVLGIEKKKDKKKQRNVVIVICSIVIGLCVVLIIGIIMWYKSRHDEQQKQRTYLTGEHGREVGVVSEFIPMVDPQKVVKWR